jgi:hypothetical protein
MPSDYSGIPKSSLHAHLQEHRDGTYGIIVCPECENRWHSCMYPRADRWWRSVDISNKVGATQMPHVHRNGAQWWVQPWEVYWCSQWYYSCSMSCTWCWDGTVGGRWTTSDGSHSATSPVYVWNVEAFDQCGWLSPFPECNVSIDDMFLQWNTFPCHRWGIFGQYLRVSHYGMPPDDCVEWELCLQHSHMYQSQYWMVVVDQERRLLELSTSDASDHQILIVVPSPTQYFPCHCPWTIGRI